MASTAAAGWADLPPDLLADSVIGRLPFPADRARLLAVCRGWRSSAREHGRIPGVPDNAVCIGATGGEWLALDCTDDPVRRVHRTTWDARPDVKHTHTYVLHNPFSSTTVPLPELDNLIGHVAETFEIRKVLARCPSAPADDVIAVTTNHWRYNVILCRPGKGTFGDELLAFHLGEDEDGGPRVTKSKLVIRNPLAHYYKDGFWSWPMDYTSDADDSDNDEHSNSAAAGDQVSSSGDEDEFEEDFEDYDDAQYQQGYEEGEDEPPYDDVIDNDYANDDLVRRRYDERVPCEAEDEIFMGRYLVQSRSGDELLLVRHRHVSSPYLYSYTLNVEVLRVDANVCSRWVPVTDGLDQGEAIYLSRSFSKCTPAYGGIQEGLVYYLHNLDLDDAFDMRSGAACEKTFWQPWQCTRVRTCFLTWLFPPEVVV
ncbi:hypothetical protein BS78_07G009100 [Paspalum vaginatum]|nr:hypothetical protein BS78_07G009100 [Paspalum vaginatum]